MTFQSDYFRGKLPDETTEMFRMGWSAIEWTEKKPSKKLSLEVMRDRMLALTFEAKPEHQGEKPVEKDALRAPLAMIAVGGMDGIRDEALVFLQKREMWGPRQQRPIYFFKSGGGAAARLAQPSAEGLWPVSEEQPDERPDDKALETLQVARARGDLIDIEANWHEAHPEFRLSPDASPFQPYAAMTQWLLDTQLDIRREEPGLRAH